MAKTLKSEDLSNFKLDSMSKRIRAVIDTNKDEEGHDLGFGRDIRDIADDLAKDGLMYAYIFHDKDIDKDGVLKRRHLHLVFECPTRRRVSYYIKHLAMLFGVERSQVQVEVSNSFDWDIQYLIHKNNKDKYRYDFKDIVSNIPLKELQERMSVEVHESITSHGILQIVMSCKTRSMVNIKLGLGPSNVFHHLIDDYCRDGWLGFNFKSKDAQDFILDQNGVRRCEVDEYAS